MSIPAYHSGRNIQNDDFSGISISSMVLPPIVPFGGVDTDITTYQYLNPSIVSPPPPYSENPTVINNHQIPNRGEYTANSYPRRLKPRPVEEESLCNLRELFLIALTLILGAITLLILLQISNSMNPKYP